jgi:uncharacterized FAD-dependent dehydrogenase
VKNKYNVIIVGSGAAGLGAAFELVDNNFKGSILVVDQKNAGGSGLRNDCKQNYSYPIGFPTDIWEKEEAEAILEKVKTHLKPSFKEKKNISIYQKRAERIGVSLVDIDQHHVGTDRSKELIDQLVNELKEKGVHFKFETKLTDVSHEIVLSAKNKYEYLNYDNLILALGRGSFYQLQSFMDSLGVKYTDNIIDIGIRVETKIDNYPIVKDYYDPKFYFPNNVRTFCTNSGFAQVVQESYDGFYSVNGHALSSNKNTNDLVNFAMLKTFKLTDPVRSGQAFASILGKAAMEIGGGKPIMQRIGDFRLDKRSKDLTFNEDLYSFKNTLNCSAGDVALAIPARIMKDIWKSLKMLDTIIPGVLRPETVLYYPEIKMYGNKPEFISHSFKVAKKKYMIGDAAGTSRGITAAWASGIRCAQGILNDNRPDILPKSN